MCLTNGYTVQEFVGLFYPSGNPYKLCHYPLQATKAVRPPYMASSHPHDCGLFVLPLAWAFDFPFGHTIPTFDREAGLPNTGCTTQTLSVFLIITLPKGFQDFSFTARQGVRARSGTAPPGSEPLMFVTSPQQKKKDFFLWGEKRNEKKRKTTAPKEKRKKTQKHTQIYIGPL
jgi:hypothetical protein